MIAVKNSRNVAVFIRDSRVYGNASIGVSVFRFYGKYLPCCA